MLTEQALAMGLLWYVWDFYTLEAKSVAASRLGALEMRLNHLQRMKTPPLSPETSSCGRIHSEYPQGERVVGLGEPSVGGGREAAGEGHGQWMGFPGSPSGGSDEGLAGGLPDSPILKSLWAGVGALPAAWRFLAWRQ